MFFTTLWLELWNIFTYGSNLENFDFLLFGHSSGALTVYNFLCGNKLVYWSTVKFFPKPIV